MEETTNPVGRPTLYTKQTCDFICARVAAGDSLRTICQSEEMPSISTVMSWQLTKPEFLEQYTAAYKIQMMGTFDGLMDLVDECDVEQIAKVREQVSIRKWVLKIHEPKRFGDKPEPVVVTTSGVDVSKLTNEELDQYVDLLAKMKKND